jgi:hypothetical protein
VRPGIWPIGAVIVVQLAFLAVLFVLAARHAPAARLLPVDALVPAGEAARIGVRLLGSQPVGPETAGVRVTFFRLGGKAGESVVDGGGAVGSSPPLVATTDSEGMALVEVRAPLGMGLDSLEASVDPSTGLETHPTRVEVVAAGAPLETGCLLVVVPDALEGALRIEPPTEGLDPAAISQPADALRDIARHAVVGYLVAPSWSDAPGLRDRLLGRGLPRGPILRGVAEEKWLLRTLRELAPDRWKAPFWVVVARPGDAGECTALGARAIVLGAASGPTGDDRVTFAPSWSDVKARVLRP